MSLSRTILGCALAALVGVCTLSPRVAVAAPVGTRYVAATWGDDRVHFLDVNMVDLGSSFPAGNPNPNGVTASSTLIYTGHFTNSTAYAYNHNGVPQFNWTSASLVNCQGVELVGNEFATVYSGNNIDFLNPANGAFIRSINNVGGSTVEGLAYDGTTLWLLGDANIIGVNPANGVQTASIPNPAVNELFGGTALTTAGAGQLIVGGTSGNWWRFSSANGNILASGNNALQMYGLDEIAVPEPGSLGVAVIMSAIMLRRRRN